MGESTGFRPETGNPNRILPCDETSGRTLRHGSCPLREFVEAQDSELPKRQ